MMSESFFWHDNDKDLTVCFLVTHLYCFVNYYNSGLQYTIYSLINAMDPETSLNMCTFLL